MKSRARSFFFLLRIAIVKGDGAFIGDGALIGEVPSFTYAGVATDRSLGVDTIVLNGEG